MAAKRKRKKKMKLSAKIYRYRRLILALSVLFAIIMFFIISSVSTDENGDKGIQTVSSEQLIFEFLTNDMELNEAAACGVLANIEKESGFDCDNTERGYTWEEGAGYGICQWTNYPRTSESGRRTQLIDWCNENGFDYKSLSGQLNFLKYELENDSTFTEDVTEKLKEVSNDAQGAYEAGYCWCYSFEVPEGFDEGVSESRGELARNKYWPKYGVGSSSKPK